MFQGDYATDRDLVEARLRPVAVSAAYAMLAALPPGSTTIVETPFPQDSTANPFALLQHHHRQRVVGGLAGDLVRGTLPAVAGAGRRTPRWTTQVTDIAGLRERGVRFVLVHKRLREKFPNALFEHPTESGPIEAALRERLGAPAFEDTWITAFRLE